MNDALLIQQADGKHSYLLNLTIKDHADYCRRYGFDYWPIYGTALTNENASRHAFWNKVALLRKGMEAGYKYVVWLDSDCWIADDTRDLREACPEDGFGLVWHGKAEWPESSDCYDHWNCGAVYVGNGANAERLLKQWWKSPDEGHFWHDQHAFNRFAVPYFERTWKSSAPIKKLGYEWNAVPFEEFACERPVVAAWHGYCHDIGQRLDAMTAYINAAKMRRMVEGCDVIEACQKADYCASVGNFDGAAQFFARARELGQESPDFLREYATCLIQMKRWGDAVPLLKEAVEAEHENGLLWRMLSGCYDFLGEHRLNSDALYHARKYSPDSPGVMLNTAFYYLRGGAWDAGFNLLKWDFAHGGRTMRHPSPEWAGWSCRRLFVWAEQGLGDTIMLYRFVLDLAEDHDIEEIVLEVQPPLVPLLKDACPKVKIVPQSPDKSIFWEFEGHIGLFSLPAIFHTTPENVGEACPYLSAPPEKVAQWAERLPDAGNLRVGFSWAGSQGHGNNVNRNMQAELFDDLVQTPRTEWYSLQHGIQIPQESVDTTPEVTWIGRECQDMADTAGILANLDLVITVDSAIAHLAGAMGKETWILLSKSSDWRWLLEREDSVWYKSVRLFRQKTLGDWGEVMERVEAALKERVSTNGS